MKEREILRKTATQDVASNISCSLTWPHFQVYAAPRFAVVGVAREKGGAFPSGLMKHSVSASRTVVR